MTPRSKRFADWTPETVEVLGVIPPVLPSVGESDSKRFTDWAPNTLQVVSAPVAEAGAVGTTLPGGMADGSVVYEDDKVTAYFDVGGRAVPPALASWKKVWTVVGGETRMKIVGLSAERPPLSASATLPESA